MVLCHFLSAQSVGIGTPSPNPKAILDVSSTDKGLLLPRLVDTSAVSAPVPAGLTIYSTSDKKVYFYDGTRWQRSSAQTASDGLWYEKNDGILYTDRKYVGVNTNLGLLPPQANLQVTGSLLVQGDYTYTQAAPTPAQTYTMNNASSQNIPTTDSIFRIFDTGGISDYLVNTQGNINCDNSAFVNQIGCKISFNSNDFGIAAGDTLWISLYGYPYCKTNYIQRWVSTSTPPSDLIVNGVFCNFIFRSNNSIVGPGFDITVTRIYKKGTSQAVNMIGPGLMYDGSKDAFRVGNQANGSIGYFSIAMGSNATASGSFSTAMGLNTTASGNTSTAIGNYTTASGYYSTAIGNFSIASGASSTATGYYTQAPGYVSTAMGHNTLASGDWSTAIGEYTIASGSNSTAIGEYTQASGSISTSMGYLTKALGSTSTTMGTGTTAKSYSSLAIGRYNDTIVGSNSYSWVPTDPILMVGNGSADNARSNAMTVYKNGNTDISGFTRLGTLSEGAPRIKYKKITLNSPNSDGGIISTLHYLTYSKILSATAVLDFGAGSITPGYRYSNGFEYSLSFDANLVYISNQAGNSANILDKPVKVLITYEE